MLLHVATSIGRSGGAWWLQHPRVGIKKKMERTKTREWVAKSINKKFHKLSLKLKIAIFSAGGGEHWTPPTYILHLSVFKSTLNGLHQFGHGSQTGKGEVKS